MKIYRLSYTDEKTIKWECPNTGMYILGHFMGDELIEYAVHGSCGCFYDSFDNFFHASNWIRKHVDKDFKAPYTGTKLAANSKNIKTAYLDGEWWIINGSALFADGDVGDFNHEAYSIQYAQDILMDGQEDWESWKHSKALDLVEEIKDNYDEDRYYEMKSEAESDPESFILNHLEEAGIDADTFFVANGNSNDPRTWSMKTLGWKRLAGNSITTWTLSSADLESIKSGIWDAYGESDSLDKEKFDIEVASNNRMYWGVPINKIESGDLSQLKDYGSRSKWGVMAAGKNKFVRIF